MYIVYNIYIYILFLTNFFFIWIILSFVFYIFRYIILPLLSCNILEEKHCVRYIMYDVKLFHFICRFVTKIKQHNYVLNNVQFITKKFYLYILVEMMNAWITRRMLRTWNLQIFATKKIILNMKCIKHICYMKYVLILI